MEKTKRLITLDILRGYFLVVIAIDHFFRFPSLFEFITGQGLLWVSASSGFFLISGVLLGILNKEKIKNNFLNVFIKIYKRAFFLYLCSITTTLFFTFLGKSLSSSLIKSGIWNNGGLEQLLESTLSLRYVYGWTDFLAYYVIFLAITPFAIWLMSKKKTWMVLLLSALVWFIRGSNFYFAWQILFISGVTVGFHLEKIKQYFASFSNNTIRNLKILLFFSSAITILISALFIFNQNFTSNPINGLFDKNTLGPGRFVLGWLWFVSLWLAVEIYWKKIPEYLNHFLQTFGRNSLLTYFIQGVVLFPADTLLPSNLDWPENTLLTIAMLGLIYLIVRGIVKIKKIPRLLL